MLTELHSRVLQLNSISLQIKEASLLTEVTLNLARGHFAAIIGPSGCGKSTLLKVIAGIHEHSDGNVHWEGRDLANEEDMRPDEIGYVPQFSIAHELLTVEENIAYALRLRVANISEEESSARLDSIFKDLALEEIADRRVSQLSGGQKRRLAMAMELVSSPLLYLCDEVTSGLDPQSEDELVKLMHSLSRQNERTVLSVTHSLRHLETYDSIIVLYQGRLAYHGPPDALAHYFDIEKPEALYPRLSERKAEQWQRSWEKHCGPYYEKAGLPVPEIPNRSPETTKDSGMVTLEKSPEPQRGKNALSDNSPASPLSESIAEPTPGVFTQFSILLERRWKLFFRDRGQVLLQLALLLGFPCLVVLFALDGLPAIRSLSTPVIGSAVEKISAQIDVSKDIAAVGGMVSILIMFQVILLALMGQNNSAREIAAERSILEKEKFAGLSPLAYVMSKAAFLAVLVVAQSLWMTIFVNQVVGFPGSLVAQAVQLILINAAITSTCLAISAWARGPEHASILSIYLVGFQLPLSGAVLAVPKMISGVTQMMIASYWGWSGFIKAMKDTGYYGAVSNVTQTNLHESTLCIWVLLAHVSLGLVFAYTGASNSRWNP